jgi:phosphoglycolate phosphatase-like HAD superfamily hydrolase
MNDVAKHPDALALDFDGVLCNGLREYFQISLNAYRQIWPDAAQDCLPTWEASFGKLRPVIETGWEMPLVLRALEHGRTEADILTHWPTIRSQLLEKENLDWRQMGVQVDALRDRWILEDLDGWLALHRFYPGVAAQLQHWLNAELPIFIITTKESRFVKILLAQAGIALPSGALYGKDCQQPKAATLRQIKAQGFDNIWFVEDRFATLTTIQMQQDLESIRLFLADWGYNTPTEREQAIATHGLHLISLSHFELPFERWLSRLEPATI